MNFIKKLFANKKPRIYYIEINDEEINKQLSHTIIQIQKEISSFKEIISSSSIEAKESALQQMQELLLTAKSEIAMVSDDVDKIINIELANSNYFAIKDESFLKDKKDQISIIYEEIASFLNIVQQRPSAEELREELLSQLVNKLDVMSISMDKLIADDFNLKAIYKNLNNL